VHTVVGGFTPAGNTSFLVVNPDFHFVLAMDVIVCTAGVGNVLLGSESLDKHEPRDILHCHIERHDQSFSVAERTER
jgi:hypothetical protein